MSTAVTEHLARSLLHRAYGDLSDVQREVIDRIAFEAPADETGAPPASTWDRLADDMARVGGSWRFIFAFLGLLLAWVVVNCRPFSLWLGAFDPFPFVFLNVVLSTLAALQAPIILMAQNRSTAADRSSVDHDYKVNLRAELEILRLHDRLDSIEDGLLNEILSRLASTDRKSAA